VLPPDWLLALGPQRLLALVRIAVESLFRLLQRKGDSGENATWLTDSELSVLSNVDRQQGSERWDLVRRGVPWVGDPGKLVDQLATKGLLTIHGSWIQLTDAGIEALCPGRRLCSVYAREQGRVLGGKLGKALDAAAGKNDVAMAAWLLDEGANPNGAYPWFRTPLETAAVYGKTAVARLLIERGAESNLRSADGWGPLMHAAWLGHTEIIQLILSADPDLTLLEAAAAGDLEAVRRYLENGMAPNDTLSSSQDWTPLDMALRGGHTAVVGILLDAGATTSHNTPLEVAAESGHVDTVAYLLDRYGESSEVITSALGEAAERGRLEVVRLLLDRGADPNGPGGNALVRAAAFGGPAVTRELLEHGATPTRQVVEQVIVCFVDVGEMPETMALLLEFGADPRAALQAPQAEFLSDEIIDLLRKTISDR
jgi:ankyrin repeat protein